MGGGNPAPTTTTTEVKMSPQQQWLFQLARPGISSWAASVPERYPGSGIQDFNNLQERGQDWALDAARAQRGVANAGAQNQNFLMGDIWNPESNPYLSRAIDASVRPITEQYQETIMPGIADEFIGAGQEFGGSRRGVAEGIAAGRYADAVGDTASKLVQDQYGNNLNANVRAQALLPQTLQAMTQPAQTVSAVGDIRQKMDQAQLNEKMSNWNYDHFAPFLQSKELLSLIGGLPGGSATATSPNQAAPWWQQALGIGSAGLGLGNALLGGAGGAGGLASLMAFI